MAATYPTKTPLYKKLGLKDGDTLQIIGCTFPYPDLFDHLPDLTESDEPEPESQDFLHLFITDSDTLTDYLRESLPALKKDGMLWVSWPKGKKEGINRDEIRSYLLSNTDLVDTKVASLNETWSGLKFMYRKDKR